MKSAWGASILFCVRPEKERFVRFKTLGKRYTPEAIQTRILYPRTYRPYVENTPVVQHSRLRSGKRSPAAN